jgi:hypothetical protein
VPVTRGGGSFAVGGAWGASAREFRSPNAAVAPAIVVFKKVRRELVGTRILGLLEGRR